MLCYYLVFGAQTIYNSTKKHLEILVWIAKSSEMESLASNENIKTVKDNIYSSEFIDINWFHMHIYIYRHIFDFLRKLKWRKKWNTQTQLNSWIIEILVSFLFVKYIVYWVRNYWPLFSSMRSMTKNWTCACKHFKYIV